MDNTVTPGSGNTTPGTGVPWECKEIPVPGLYAKIVTFHPCKLLLATTIVCLICVALGAVIPEAPDFGEAGIGFEPRGTDFALKHNARLQLHHHPAHRHCLDCDEAWDTPRPAPEHFLKFDQDCSICDGANGSFKPSNIAGRDKNNNNRAFTCREALDHLNRGSAMSCSQAKNRWSGPCCTRRLGGEEHEDDEDEHGENECDNPYRDEPFSNWQTKADVMNSIAVCYGYSQDKWALYCMGNAMQRHQYDLMVTLEHPDGENKDISGVGMLRDVCKFSRKLKGSGAYQSHGRRDWHGGGMCPLYSLSELLMLLDALMTNNVAQMNRVASGSVSCDEVSDDLLNRVYPRMQFCGKLLMADKCYRGIRDGDLTCDEDHCNSACQSKCTQDVNLIVNYIFTYIADVDWRNPATDSASTSLTGTGIVLPIGEEGGTKSMYTELVDEFSDYFGGDQAVKIAGIKFKGKGDLFNDKLMTDSLLAAAACGISIVILIIHTRSFTISFVAIAQIFGSLAVAYFYFRVVLNFGYFSFLNMNMVFVAVAIGVDDVFVFMDAYKQSYQFLPKDCPMESRIHWTTMRSFSAMSVTTLTTVTAFTANIVSPITTIKLFGVWAACVIIADFFLMLTVLPAILVLVETTCCRKLCVCGDCNRSMVDSQTKTGEVRARFMERAYEGYIAPVVTHKWLKFIWFFLFTAFGVFCLTQAVGIKKSDAEELQLFIDSHPAEKYDMKWLDRFRFEGEHRSAEGMPVAFIAGVVPSDTGNYFEPFEVGHLVFSEGSLTNTAAQTYYAGICDSFSSGPLYDWSRFCMYHAVRELAKKTCGSQGSTRECCSLGYPMEENKFNTCVKAVIRIRDMPRALDRWHHWPGYMLDLSGNLKVVKMEYISKQRYTAKVDTLQDFFDKVDPWASGKVSAPAGVVEPFWWSELAWWDLQRSLNQGAFMSCGVALGCCAVVLLLVIGNAVMALQALISILFILSSVVATLILFGWVLDLMVAVVMAICVGLCVDFVCHMSHAYVHAGDESKVPLSCAAQLCWRNADERQMRASRALGTMGITVTMGALTTLGGGLAMVPATVKFFYQFGVFLVVTMFWAFIYATIHFPSMAAICGPVGKFGDLWGIYAKVCFCCCRKKSAAGNEN